MHLHPQCLRQEPCLQRIHVLETSQFHKQLIKQLMHLVVGAGGGNIKGAIFTQAGADSAPEDFQGKLWLSWDLWKEE